MIRPQTLTVKSFAHYPPQAQAFIADHLAVLQQIPVPLLSILLAQIIHYDSRFPAEQQTLARQLHSLKEMLAAEFAALMAPFAALELPDDLARMDWVQNPRRFNERLSASLWSTHQIDAYREAGHKYEERLADALNGEAPAIPRLAIVIVGNGASQTSRTLFRDLRPHGALFTAVQPAGTFDALVACVNKRAQTHPERYAHWYIDGGTPRSDCGEAQGITVMSYRELAAFAFKELNLMNRFAGNPQMQTPAGPEEVTSYMASLGPADLGFSERQGDPVLHEFETSIFTEGAGTQVFSTTFVQWSAREALRRAQPVTLLARFCPRQMMAPMSVLLKRNPFTQAMDPQGSLIDADMGAWYTWINQARLAGADQARFLVWFEEHELALAISPSLPRGTVSASAVTMQQVLQWMD
ncbi:hypothetical protein [Paracidobacterium acidisoli]|uniref:Uncharacterized protein n=1 Tax=Paracidobacterium acidisoli TaxID=2303751 RepID=A0A372IK85_9BACT|nr:hypothetical protein [Paracidobacterium acidisoli]MBT9333078.1 hypothetical protein [Paracidobacterium acidisoli]